MRKLILSSIRAHAGRYVAGGVAIVLGVAFVATALLVLTSTKGALADAVGGKYARADLVLTSGRGSLPADVARAAAAADGVAAAAGVAGSAVQVGYPGSPGRSWVRVSSVPANPDLRWYDLRAGRLPERRGEVAVAEETARDRHVRPGDSLRVSGYDETSLERVRVVGIVAGSSLVQVALIAPDEAVAAWNAGADASGEQPAGRDAAVTSFDEVLVRAASASDLTRVRQAVTAAARESGAREVQVQTGQERASDVVSSLTGDVDVLGAFLVAFGVIAVFVATLVVSNTFTIVLAQRTRELALLRCVGGLRRQVFGTVVAESVALGAVGSLVGLLVGAGLAAVAMTLLGRASLGLPPGTLQVDATAVVLPVAAGILTTVGAALVPARRATRVPPLAALRPDLAVGIRTRTGMVRLASGLVLLLAGTLVVVAGMRVGVVGLGLALGLGGGLVSFLGILLASPLFVPAVVRVIGVLAARLAGTPGRLAVGNAIRNPGRTAATATALLVGVTLISMMNVGSMSVRKTVDVNLDSQAPLDVSVTANSGGIPARTPAAIRRVEGVAAVASLKAVPAQAIATGPTTGPGNGGGAGNDGPGNGGGAGNDGEGNDDGEVTVAGIDAAAARSVLRIPRPVEGLRDGVAVGSEAMVRRLGTTDGGRLALRTASDGRLAVRVHVVADQLTSGLLVTARDLDRLAPRAQTGVVWARIADTAQTQSVLSRVEEVASARGDLTVAGGATQRALYEQIMDILLLVATALLAVAVLIALVGVGNTLSLSVIERTREQALLRALGLTRGQLRGMLATEALLVAATAVVLGLGLGIAYGWAGTNVLLGPIAEQVSYAVPTGRLLLVAAVALVAGLAASVLPARRATRIPPAAALAEE